MTLDVLYLILIVFAIIKGISRGLVVGVFSILAFIIGLAAALKLSAIVAQRLQESAGAHGPWLPVVSFFLVFIVVAVAVSWLAKLVDKAFDIALLGWVNMLGGIVLYVVIYTILFSVMLFYVENTGMVKPETLAESTTYPYIQPWGPKLMDNIGSIIPVFKSMFAQLENFFEGVAKKAG